MKCRRCHYKLTIVRTQHPRKMPFIVRRERLCNRCGSRYRTLERVSQTLGKPKNGRYFINSKGKRVKADDEKRYM